MSFWRTGSTAAASGKTRIVQPSDRPLPGVYLSPQPLRPGARRITRDALAAFRSLGSGELGSPRQPQHLEQIFEDVGSYFEAGGHVLSASPRTEALKAARAFACAHLRACAWTYWATPTNAAANSAASARPKRREPAHLRLDFPDRPTIRRSFGEVLPDAFFERYGLGCPFAGGGAATPLQMPLERAVPQTPSRCQFAAGSRAATRAAKGVAETPAAPQHRELVLACRRPARVPARPPPIWDHRHEAAECFALAFESPPAKALAAPAPARDTGCGWSSGSVCAPGSIAAWFCRNRSFRRETKDVRPTFNPPHPCPPLTSAPLLLGQLHSERRSVRAPSEAGQARSRSCYIPLHDVDTLCFTSTCTSPRRPVRLLRRRCQSIIILAPGDSLGDCPPFAPSSANSAIRLEQYRAHSRTGPGVTVAKAVVQAKISNQTAPRPTSRCRPSRRGDRQPSSAWGS